LGDNDNGPAVIKRAIVIENGKLDLGTDPTDQQLGDAVDELEADTATYIKYTATNVPAGLCTAADSCHTVGSLLCGKKNLAANPATVSGGRCFFFCVDLPEPDNMIFWGAIDCP
jgi:hypothetical protein